MSFILGFICGASVVIAIMVFCVVISGRGEDYR